MWISLARNETQIEVVFSMHECSKLKLWPILARPELEMLLKWETSLKKQRGQISQPSLIDRGREICLITTEGGGIEEKQIMGHRVCFSTNPPF